MSPDDLDSSSRSGSPSIEIPRIDLMNEMEDLLQLRLESPPVDRTVSSYFLYFGKQVFFINDFWC